MAERGLKLWNRRKNNGGPLNPLRVSFLGEKGTDTGALAKEFLSSELYTFCLKEFKCTVYLLCHLYFWLGFCLSRLILFCHFVFLCSNGGLH